MGLTIFHVVFSDIPHIQTTTPISKNTKVETPIHDNDLIMTPIIAPQSG